MNINLIWPAEIEKQSGLYPPLGLAYISAVLKEAGYKPNMIDLAFDLDLNQIKDLKDEGAIYGVSFTTSQYTLAKEVIGLIKEKDPSGTIICGGAHPSVMPEHVLSSTKADVVVRNEGEYTFLELTDCIENGKSLDSVDGIYYHRRDGKIVKTSERAPIPNLDELPFPDQGSFPIEKYFALKGFRELSIISARGCPGRCTFCYPTVQNMFGRKIRFRSAGNIVDEIEFLMGRFKIDMVVFSDDTLTVSKRRMMELSSEIDERGIHIFWRGQTRANAVEKDMLKQMKKAGCYLLSFGVESGSQQILNNIRKNITVKQIEDAFKICKEVGILPHAFLMVGNLGETKETIDETMELLKAIKPFNVSVTITTPYPGTDLYDIAKEGGILASEDWSIFDYTSESTAFIKNPDLSHQEMINAKRAILERQKKESEKLKDFLSLLTKERFLIKIGRTALKNPSFVFRSAKLGMKSLKSAGFEIINPRKGG